MGLDIGAINDAVLDGLDAMNTDILSIKIAKGIVDYWSGAVSGLGGSPIAVAVVGTLNDGISSALSAPTKVGKLPALKIAKTINEAFLSMQVAGGAHGSGPLSNSGIGGLISDLGDAFASPQKKELFALSFAKAVHTYTQQGITGGSGVGTGPPDIGPLS